MKHLALARLRRTPGRYLACALAVTIAVGFAVLVQLVGAGMSQVVRDGDVASVAGADVAVRAVWRQAEVDPTDPDALAAAVAADDAAVTAVAELDGVAAVHRAGVAFADAVLPRAVGEQTVNVAAAPPEGDLRWPRLREGRWPDRPGEVAAGGDARVGDEVVLLPFVDEGAEPVRVPLTVVGVVDVGLASDFRFDGLFLVPEQAHPLGAGQLELLLDAAPGTDPETLQRSLQAAVGPGSPAPWATSSPPTTSATSGPSRPPAWCWCCRPGSAPSPRWPSPWPWSWWPTRSRCCWPSGSGSRHCCAASGPRGVTCGGPGPPRPPCWGWLRARSGCCWAGRWPPWPAS